MKPKYLNDSLRSFSPWISPTLRTQSNGGASCSDPPHVLLVDDRDAFRRDVAFALTHVGIEVTEATGVYDALRLSHHHTVDWVVIRGNLQSQDGWRCAAKLCGAPPWPGVLVHFDELIGRDRKWGYVSGVAGLVETGGRPAKLLGPLFAVLDAAMTTPVNAVASKGLMRREGRPSPSVANRPDEFPNSKPADRVRTHPVRALNGQAGCST